MNSRLILGIAAAVAVLVVAVGGAGSAVRAADGGSISGRIYVDEDMDGLRDPGEPPVKGRQVELWQYFDGPPYEALIDTDTTDGRGAYTLTGMAPNTRYWVRLVFEPHTPCQTKEEFEYPPGPGEQGFTPDFGILREGKGSVSGTIVDDRDEDGVRDPGEPGLEGWDVELNTDYAEGTGIHCTFSDLTDYSGRFGFYNLPLMPYRVSYWSDRFLPFVITSPVEPREPHYPHDPLVDLQDNAQASGVDILAHSIKGASAVKGIAFRDLNLNAVRDEGEEVLGCSVYRNTVNVSRQTPAGRLYLSDDDINCDIAEFTLSGIVDGTYVVELGQWCTGPNAGDAAWISGPVRTVTIAGGRQEQPLEMGMCPQAQAWYPDPETPTPTPTVTLKLPDVGAGQANEEPSSAVLVVSFLMAMVGLTGLAFANRRKVWP